MNVCPEAQIGSFKKCLPAIINIVKRFIIKVKPIRCSNYERNMNEKKRDLG